jgi:hypothetical protein
MGSTGRSAARGPANRSRQTGNGSRVRSRLRDRRGLRRDPRDVEEQAMHLQVRSNPKLSPPDVEKFLDRLAKAGVNLASAGGSNAEFGGEFAVALEDADRKKATDALDKQPGYTYKLLEAGVDPGLTLCWVKDQPGSLLRDCIAGVAEANRKSGRKIRDVLVGQKRPEGIPVQVYSE